MTRTERRERQRRRKLQIARRVASALLALVLIPVSNLTRDMWGLARTAAVETNNIPLQYEMEKAIYNITNTSNKSRYYAILYRALEQGDMDTYRHIRDDLMNSMGVDGASIDSVMRSRYNKAVEEEPDYTLPQRARDLIGSRDQYAPPKEKEETFGADDLGSGAYQAYSDQRANDYRSMADGLAGSPIFRGMDDETRDKVLKAAYDLADKSALEDHSDGQYKITTKWMTLADEAEAVGVEPWEYVLFHVAYNEAETTRDENGDAMKGETILICILMNRWVEKLAVPSLLVFIALGMCFGENGLLHIQFDDYAAVNTICSVSLIFIMFYGGFGTNLTAARPVAVQSVVLSTLGVACTAGSVAVFVHLVFHLSWAESLLIGSVISSTDAASVFNILRTKKLALKEHTDSLLEIESGSNDPISYMLTSVAVAVLTGQEISVPLLLLQQIALGAAGGLLLGRLAAWILGRGTF